MIRVYRKKPIKDPDYQRLLILTVKEKYISLMIGLLVAFAISSLTYKTFLKNIRINLAFKFPVIKFDSKVIKNKVVAKKPLKTYVIAEGDDLWYIAEKFYGSGFNAYDISMANKITDSSLIETGTKIIIPDVKPRQPTVGDILNGASTDQVTYTEGKYVVQPGDSLSIIAQKVYGDLYAWPRIMNANNLATPDQIEAGMVLIIPR
jgi:LysM repeat protein